MEIPVAAVLRKLRERAGFSMERLARECGYKGASSYQRYENADQFTKSLLPVPLAIKIASALSGHGDPPVTREEALALAGVRPDADGRLTASGVDARSGTDNAILGQPEIDLQKATNLPASNTLIRDLPVYGVAVGGKEEEFSFNGSVVDYVRRPPSLMKINNAFGVYVTGDSMSPRFENGDLVFVHPGRPAKPGNDVIVELHGEHGAPGPCYIKRLVRRTDNQIVLAQFNPPRGDITIDAARLTPQVAAPHSPENSAPVDTHTGTAIDQAYIGACTGAKLDDLRMVARIVGGRRVADGVRFFVAPASVRIADQAEREGTLESLRASGATILHSACGACIGLGPARLGAGEVGISSSSRNFQGRMGDPSSQTYLSSPYTVAASALAGCIADPRGYL